jgi:hypothetical protein
LESSQPLPKFVLVLVVNESEGEEDQAKGGEAEDAVKRFEPPHIEQEHACDGAGDDTQAEPAVANPPANSTWR